MRRRHAGFLLAAVLCVSTALAHHSPAMFDQERELTLSGTVRLFQWSNPHSYIQLVVQDEQGRQEEWSVEMAAPTYLQQQGWRPSTVKPGDELTVVIHPLRNMPANKGGLLLKAMGADGKPLGKNAANAP
jgi:hypothetical protein